MTTLNQHSLNPQYQQPVQQQPQQTQYPAEIANFNLLFAKDKRNARAPDYFGSMKINGIWYQISTWISYARNSGEQYLSNSVRPCTPEEAQRHEERDARFQRGNGQQQQQMMQQQHPLQPQYQQNVPVQQQWGQPPVQAPTHPEVPGTSQPDPNMPF